ncbi:MAG: serine/threonine-protein kinase [Myxococcota bacterium]
MTRLEPARSTTASTPPKSVGDELLRRDLEERLFGGAQPVCLGRFSILESLGKGGMGAVYSAYDPDLDRRVAIKVLHSRGARNPDATKRLLREAKALAKLSHPSVVTVHEVGVQDGRVFLAMEYARGGTLSSWATTLTDDPSREAKIVARMHECIDGLSAAHAAGLVHRDFKPANVLITADGRAKVADFGLVHIGAPDEPGNAPGEVGTTNPVAGTPAYMAPEQFRGTADARSDQFGLCVTFFEVLYGTRPFPGETPMAILASIESRAIATPASVGSERLLAVLRQGLHREPDQRFASMTALRSALVEARRGRRRVPLASLAGVSLLGVAAAFAVQQNRAEPVRGAPCPTGEEALSDAWGSGRQAAMRSAFEATGRSNWRGQWDRVYDRTERWASAWSEAYRSSCEATVGGTQSEHMHELRSICLFRLRDRMATLASGYSAVDAETIDSVTRSSLLLPEIHQCSDRANMIFADGAADLTSPSVQHFYALYEQHVPLTRQGRNAEAELYLHEAAMVAQEHDLRRLASTALQRLVTVMIRSGDFKEAEDVAQRALELAERSGDRIEVARSWIAMAAAAESDERYDDYSFYMARARANADAGDAPGELRAELLTRTATEHERAGRSTDAAREYLAAAALLAELGARPDKEATYRGLGALQLFFAGQTREAIEIGADALAASMNVAGPHSATTIGAGIQLAQYHLMTGQLEEALRLSQDAVDGLLPTASASYRIKILAAHADILFRNERTGEGLALLESLVGEAGRELGPRAESTLLARSQYAGALATVGRLADAAPHYAFVVEAHESVTISTPSHRGAVLLDYAVLLSKLGRHDEALHHLARADEALVPEGSGGQVMAVRQRLLFGEVVLRAGERERARTQFELGLAAAEAGDAAPAKVAEIEAHLATLGEG